MQKKANLKQMLVRGIAAGIPAGVLMALLKKSYNAAAGPDLVPERIPVLDIPVTANAKKIKSSGFSMPALRSGASRLLDKALIATKIKKVMPISKLDIIRAKLRQATVAEALGAGAGVSGGAYLGTKAWDAGETAYLKHEIKAKNKALNDALIQEQEQRLKLGHVKQAFLNMRLADLYNMAKSQYQMLTPTSKALIGGLGIAAPAYTAGATYDAVRATDRNLILKKEIKQKLRERLSSGRGASPSLISLYGTGVQPFRRGAKALVDPNASRDVLADL